MWLVLSRPAAESSIDSNGEDGTGKDFGPVVIASLSSLIEANLIDSLRQSLPAAAGLPTTIGGLIRKVRLFPGRSPLSWRRQLRPKIIQIHYPDSFSNIFDYNRIVGL